jgi:hypothetical protein
MGRKGSLQCLQGSILIGTNPVKLFTDIYFNNVPYLYLALSTGLLSSKLIAKCYIASA